jgi:multisubunit Na+/H+ antiporter MnhG subunit
MLIIIYLLACIIIAMMGKDTIVGPFGFFIIALLLTPVVSCIILLASNRRESKPTTR